MIGAALQGSTPKRPLTAGSQPIHPTGGPRPADKRAARHFATNIVRGGRKLAREHALNPRHDRKTREKTGHPAEPKSSRGGGAGCERRIRQAIYRGACVSLGPLLCGRRTDLGALAVSEKEIDENAIALKNSGLRAIGKEYVKEYLENEPCLPRLRARSTRFTRAGWLRAGKANVFLRETNCAIGRS